MDNKKTTIAYSINVHGRVQGVGFRYFTLQVAREHSIKGWVRNTKDNTVVIHCEGNRENIEAFTKKLNIGPQLSNVTKLVITDAKVEFHTGFTIK